MTALAYFALVDRLAVTFALGCYCNFRDWTRPDCSCMSELVRASANVSFSSSVDHLTLCLLSGEVI